MRRSMFISTFTSGRRTLVVCAALALATIQVIDWSVFRTSTRQLSNNQNDNSGKSSMQLSNNQNDDKRVLTTNSHPKAILIPADGPDPHPQEVIDAVRRQDPVPIDPSCIVTSQVRITNYKHLHKDGSGFGPMIMQSLNAEGMPKTIGGDEYYVTYTAGGTRASSPNGSRSSSQSPDAVAHIVDLEDGRYELHFVQPFGPNINDKPRPTSAFESDIGLLEINLEYTCGIGALSPPTKSNWITGGYIQSHWEAVVDSSMIPSVTMAKDRQMPYRFGSWFSKYDGIYTVGNSLMRTFVEHMRSTMYYSAYYKHPLNMDTLDGWFTTIDTLLREHPEAEEGNCAIVLGSGVWDMGWAEWASLESHIEAMEKYIDGVKARAPLADIYWKSMTGLHIMLFHESGVKAGIKGGSNAFQVGLGRERLKYMSSSRAKALYQAQIEVLQRKRIPYLDMYNMTYEAQEWHNINDVIHYNYGFNRFLLDHFFPNDPSLTGASLRSLIVF